MPRFIHDSSILLSRFCLVNWVHKVVSLSHSWWISWSGFPDNKTVSGCFNKKQAANYLQLIWWMIEGFLMIFSHAMIRHRYHSSYCLRVLITWMACYAYVNYLICAYAYSEIGCCKDMWLFCWDACMFDRLHGFWCMSIMLIDKRQISHNL